MSWNGYNEPVDIGDRVRVMTNSTEWVGEVFIVIEILPAGTPYHHNGVDPRESKTPWLRFSKNGETPFFNKRMVTVGNERHNCWKLPPDHDDTTDEERIKKERDNETHDDAIRQMRV